MPMSRTKGQQAVCENGPLQELMGATIELKLNPETGKYDVVTVESAGELSAAKGIAGFAEGSFGGVPIGAAIVGGLTAGLFDAVVRLIPVVDIPRIDIPTNVRRAILFAIGSWVAQTDPVRNFLGDTGAMAASLILAADAVQELINLRGILGGALGQGQTTTGHRGTTSDATQQQMATLQAELHTFLQSQRNLEQVPAIALARQTMAGL